MPNKCWAQTCFKQNSSEKKFFSGFLCVWQQLLPLIGAVCVPLCGYLCVAQVIKWFSTINHSKSNCQFHMLQQSESTENQNNRFYIMIISLLFGCVRVCETTKAYNLFDFYFFSVGGNHLYVWWFTLRFISLGWFFFRCSLSSFRKTSFDWLIPIHLLIHSNKRIHFSWFHTFVCNGVNQWMELYSFGFKNWSTQKERRARGGKRERMNGRLPTTVSIYLIGIKSSHPQVWNALSNAHKQTQIRIRILFQV